MTNDATGKEFVTSCGPKARTASASPPPAAPSRPSKRLASSSRPPARSAFACGCTSAILTSCALAPNWRHRDDRSPLPTPRSPASTASRRLPFSGLNRSKASHRRASTRPTRSTSEKRRATTRAGRPLQPRVMPQKDRSPKRLSPIGASFTSGSLPMRQREIGSPRGSLRRSRPDEGVGASGGSRRGPGDRGLPRAPRVNRRRGREPRRYDEAGGPPGGHGSALLKTTAPRKPARSRTAQPSSSRSGRGCRTPAHRKEGQRSRRQSPGQVGISLIVITHHAMAITGFSGW